MQLPTGMHVGEGISILQSHASRDAILVFPFMILLLMLPTHPDLSTRSSYPVS